MAKPPIINCHIHLFTGDHVPPWLARTYLPWPFYFVLPVSAIVGLLRWWYKGPNNFFFSAAYKRIVGVLYAIRMFVARNFILHLISIVVGAFVTINVFFFLYDLVAAIVAAPPKAGQEVTGIEGFFIHNSIISQHPNVWLMLFYILLLLLFFKWGRNLILFVFNQLWKFMKLLPGKKTIELLKRYILIGRYSRYQGQAGIFSKLSGQYPTGTGFVILPMDMRFMGAGKPPKDIDSQMAELATLKENHPATVFPFVFADPRRMQDKTYFDYTVDTADGAVTLVDGCLMKELLVDLQFSGIKIYPALGYFPFDETLLPLYKYAVQNNLPITTHCIRGTIFYRGPKKKDWDHHPLFQQAMGKGDSPTAQGQEDDEKPETKFTRLLLPQRRNVDFTPNFTHPLNYLCLLDEILLRQLVGQAKDPRIKIIFGYKDEGTAMDRNLDQLKMCFGHFGGDDEWQRFEELDRDNNSRQLVKRPNRGIEFLYNNNTPKKELRPGKPELIWKFTDWYTIISTLLLQYPNTYADISYILHNPAILPLLKQTLENPVLRQRVLYGTDFYVVRNHKSDKEMLADLAGGLSEADFDLIARINPRSFLLTHQNS